MTISFSPFPLVAKYQARARRADGFSSILCKRVCWASMAAAPFRRPSISRPWRAAREQTDGRRLTGAPHRPNQTWGNGPASLHFPQFYRAGSLHPLRQRLDAENPPPLTEKACAASSIPLRVSGVPPLF